MVLSEKQQQMVAVFEKHVGAEMAGDLDTTMATMSDAPHLNHVPTMAGGVGRTGVHAFYRDHLVGKFFPPDVKMVSVSRTVGQDQAGVLVQVGLLDPKGLPVTGAESARKVVNPKLPARKF
jgi:carboxymethylenebutenolidase